MQLHRAGLPSTAARAVLAAVLLSALSTQALANEGLVGENIPSLRGALPNQSFLSDGEVEAINTASGNVMLSIPLGQVFSVGPHIRYQLRATHNSDSWDHIEFLFDNVRAALPQRSSNAGVGWEVHFGQLYAPDPPSGMSQAEKDAWPNRDPSIIDIGKRWLYVAPDGAAHYLYALGGRTSSHDGWPIRYSKDGSQLRMRQVNADTVIVEHPSGFISHFERATNRLGTICPTAGCWRLKEMRDYYGNKVSVSYSQSGSTETWRIADSVGRVHRIYFHLDSASRAGGDASPSNPLRIPSGDELGDLLRLVNLVEVAAAHGSTAVYDFSYQIRTISRSRPHDPLNALGAEAALIRVPLLTRISVPNSADYIFSHYTDFPRSGRIQRVQFPTQGKYDYDYGSWTFPTRCVWSHDITAKLHFIRTGVIKKRHLDPDSNEIARWSYSSSLGPTIPAQNYSGPNCRRADYRRTTMTGPSVANRRTRVRSFHAVTQGPKHPLGSDPIGDWQVTDTGLPYRKDVRMGSSNSDYLFLSEIIDDCNPTCTPVRRKYVRYAMERRTCSIVLVDKDPGDCFRINPVLVRERTLFKDDGNKWREVRRSGIDGAGHTRTMEILDNFTGSERKVEHYTGYNATGSTTLPVNPTTGYYLSFGASGYLPRPTQAWILTPYSNKLRTDSGLTYRTGYQFDSKGSITCVRKRVSSGSDGARDLVTRFTLGATAGTNAGLPVQEIVAGGQNGALGNGTCNTAGSEGTNKFTFTHTYEHDQRASTRIAGFPYRYRATIDRNSGLPSVTYNPSDQATHRRYDLLGRPTRIAPEASLGEAETLITYNNPEGGEANVYIERVFNGSRRADEHLYYDWFGRLRREIQSIPTGLGSHGDSERETVYDVLGRVTAVSTVQRASNVNNVQNTTRYSGYDAFGRPARILRADLTDERLTYAGERERESKLNIRTSQTGTSEVTTTTRFDGLGRPTSVENPSYTVVNQYDPNGKLLEVERRQGTFSQKREYGWDNRGLLVSERHPEIGSTASPGTISFRPDALGNPREVFDGRITLTHEYDGDGRLLRKRQGTRVWEEHRWANSNVGSDYRKGKIYESIRHNHPGDGSDWAIAETYEYRGKLGRMSKRTTQLRWLHQTDPASIYGHTFDQTWTYNVLGEVVAQTYPRCITTPQNGLRYCNDPADLQAPQHTVSRTMNQRLPVRVSSSLGMSADYDYHWNYQLARIDYSNGAYTELAQGTRGMKRPASIRHRAAGGGLLFDSGTYRYDDAGNMWEIGPDNYVYDSASRLIRGTARSASRWEEYLYDPADNLVRLTRDGVTVQHHNIDTNKNRRIGFVGNPPDTAYDAAGNFDYLGPAEDPFFDLDHDAFNMITRFYRKVPEAQFLYGYGPGNYRLITLDTSTGEAFWTFRDTDGKILREHRAQGWGPYRSPAEPGETWEFVKDYVHGPNGLIATRDRGGLETFFHQDHIGSPRIVTNGAGQQIGAQDYYPYGFEAAVSGVQEPHSKFAGHEVDRHKVLYYMLARSYVQDWGRFANVDPARSSWNLYAYAGNNPIKFVDPTGLAIQVASATSIDEGYEELAALQLALEEAQMQDLASRLSLTNRDGAIFIEASGNLDDFTQSGNSTAELLGLAIESDLTVEFGLTDQDLSKQSGARTSVLAPTQKILINPEQIKSTLVPGVFTGGPFEGIEGMFPIGLGTAVVHEFGHASGRLIFRMPAGANTNPDALYRENNHRALLTRGSNTKRTRH